MWNLLRTEPLKSFHFRRQVKLGSYYADFASHGAKLVVEIDGDSHFTNGAGRRDAVRSDHVEAEGYRVVRFTNIEVAENLEGVAARLLAVLEETPTPALTRRPSPQGGGRKLGELADENTAGEARS